MHARSLRALLPVAAVASLAACGASHAASPHAASPRGAPATAAAAPCRADTATIGRLQRVVDSVVAARPDVRGVALHVIAPARCLDRTVVAGIAGADASVPLTAATPVRIASNTKTYLAAAVLRLVEERRVGLDDPIARHVAPEHVALLREGGYDPEAITVRHLLSHTSGLPDHAQDEEGYIGAIVRDPRHAWTRTEQLRLAMTRGKRQGAPGEAFHYSDTGYILLGELVERRTGRTLGPALRTLLAYDRLGLAATWYETFEPAPAGSPARAHQFFGEHDTYDWSPTIDLYGGGGLVATAGDMATFTRAVFTGRVFRDPATLGLMETIPVPPPAGRGGYGLGAMSRAIDGTPTWGHTGFWGTFSVHAPEADVTIAGFVLQNRAFRATGTLERAALAAARGAPAAR